MSSDFLWSCESIRFFLQGTKNLCGEGGDFSLLTLNKNFILHLREIIIKIKTKEAVELLSQLNLIILEIFEIDVFYEEKSNFNAFLWIPELILNNVRIYRESSSLILESNNDIIMNEKNFITTWKTRSLNQDNASSILNPSNNFVKIKKNRYSIDFTPPCMYKISKQLSSAAYSTFVCITFCCHDTDSSQVIMSDFDPYYSDIPMRGIGLDKNSIVIYGVNEENNLKQIQFDISSNKNKYWITASILWGSKNNNYKSHFKIIKTSTRKKSILAEKNGIFEANKISYFSSPEIVIGALKIKKPTEERKAFSGSISAIEILPVVGNIPHDILNLIAEMQKITL